MLNVHRLVITFQRRKIRYLLGIQITVSLRTFEQVYRKIIAYSVLLQSHEPKEFLLQRLELKQTWQLLYSRKQ